MKTFLELQHEWGESRCGRSIEQYTYDYFEGELTKSLERAVKIDAWLSSYRDALKKSNVFHVNEAVIREINELLQP